VHDQLDKPAISGNCDKHHRVPTQIR
jgi:hypothetical protein